MYIQNGIAYAGQQPQLLKVCAVKPLPGHRLWARFSTGEARVFDLTPLLEHTAFAPLRDEALFRQVYLDYGCPSWMDGAIDIAPEKLYQDGTPSWEAVEEVPPDEIDLQMIQAIQSDPDCQIFS